MRGPEIQCQTGLTKKFVFSENVRKLLVKAHQARETSYDVCFTLKRVLLIIPINRNNLLKVHHLVTHPMAHYMYCKPLNTGEVYNKISSKIVFYIFLPK